jgi:hypothetical protein
LPIASEISGSAKVPKSFEVFLCREEAAPFHLFNQIHRHAVEGYGNPGLRGALHDCPVNKVNLGFEAPPERIEHRRFIVTVFIPDDTDQQVFQDAGVSLIREESFDVQPSAQRFESDALGSTDFEKLSADS